MRRVIQGSNRHGQRNFNWDRIPDNDRWHWEELFKILSIPAGYFVTTALLFKAKNITSPSFRDYVITGMDGMALYLLMAGAYAQVSEAYSFAKVRGVKEAQLGRRVFSGGRFFDRLLHPPAYVGMLVFHCYFVSAFSFAGARLFSAVVPTSDKSKKLNVNPPTGSPRLE